MSFEPAPEPATLNAILIPENLGTHEPTVIGTLRATQVLKLLVGLLAGVAAAYLIPAAEMLHRVACIAAGAAAGTVLAVLKIDDQPLEKQLARYITFRSRPQKLQHPTVTVPWLQESVKAIVGDMYLLPQGRYAKLLELQAVELEAMSDAEQQALFTAYQQFLNSLQFDIVLKTRLEPYDVEHYLSAYRKRFAALTENPDTAPQNLRLRSLLKDHMSFYEKLCTENVILVPCAYLIVTVSHAELAELDSRVAQLKEALAQCGIAARSLKHAELKALLYKYTHS